MSLVYLPFSAFASIADAGWQVHVWCLSCWSKRRIEITDALRPRRVFGASFRCRCGTRGRLSVEPSERIKPNAAIKHAVLFCKRCIPCWEIHDYRPGVPPWPTLAKGDRFRCPGCGATVGWTWYRGDAPHSDGYQTGAQSFR